MASEEPRPAPLIRPPELRVNEERTASRLELFFDLAYVLVFAELATTLAEDLSWQGALEFAGLFTITWWSWVTVTLYANRFDTNDVLYRLAKLGGTMAIIGMAASAQEAIGKKAVIFTLAYLATRVLLLILYLRAYRHVREARPTIMIYLIGVGAGAACWTVALAVPGNARYALWAAGILVEALAPLAATRYGNGVPLHLEHLPERFGLFVILVLGESIASIVHGLHDNGWQATATWMAAIAFVAVAAAWWDYFDLGGAAGKRKLEDDGDDQESGIADAYIYGHLPLTLGLAIFAVGIEQLVLHPDEKLALGANWALAGGAALYFAGTAAVMAGTSGRVWAAWPWPIAGLPAFILIGLLPLNPATTMAAIGAVLVVSALLGTWAQRRGDIETSET